MLTWTDPDHPVPNRKYDTHLAQVLRLCHLLEQEVIENMKERSSVQLMHGQIWRSSDPRRLFAFAIGEDMGEIRRDNRNRYQATKTVIVKTIYPVYQLRELPARAFLRLGTKGYTRVS